MNQRSTGLRAGICRWECTGLPLIRLSLLTFCLCLAPLGDAVSQGNESTRTSAPLAPSEICGGEDEPFLIDLRLPDRESSYPGANPGNPPDKARYGLKLTCPKEVGGGYSSYAVALAASDGTPAGYNIVEDMDGTPGNGAPKRFRVKPSGSANDPNSPQFNLVLAGIEFSIDCKKEQPFWIEPPSDSFMGCLSHLLAEAARIGVVNAGPTQQVQPTDLKRTDFGATVPDATTNASLFPLQKKPFWVIHTGPLPKISVPSRPLIRAAGARPVTEEGPAQQELVRQVPPGAQEQLAEDPTPSPTRASAEPEPTPPTRTPSSPTPTPETSTRPPTTPAPAQPETISQRPPETQVSYSIQLVEEGTDPKQQRPDFQALVPHLQEKLCLMRQDGRPVPPPKLEGGQLTVKLEPSDLSKLLAGQVQEPSSVKGSRPRPATTVLKPACKDLNKDVPLKPGRFVAQVEPTSPEQERALRLRVKLPRALHRAHVLDEFMGKSAPPAPSSAPEARWSVRSTEGADKWEPVGKDRDAQLIMGFPLEYRLEAAESGASLGSGAPSGSALPSIAFRTGADAAPCPDPSAPQGKPQKASAEACTLVTLKRPLHTQSLTLSLDVRGDCAPKERPSSVRLQAAGAGSTQLWPDTRALTVGVGKPEDVPSGWLPMTAALLAKDEPRWTLDSWQVRHPGSDSKGAPPPPLRLKPKLASIPVPVRITGYEGATLKSLQVANLCGEPEAGSPLSAGPMQPLVLDLNLPSGMAFKEIKPFLKTLKQKPILTLEPPRGLRLKGCGPETATCAVELVSVFDDQGVHLTLEAAPRVTLIYVFLSKQLQDPEALYYGLEAHLKRLRERQPKGGTVRLVVTNGRTVSTATDDPAALAETLQKVVEWPARGIAPQVLERLAESARGLSGIRRDWLELDLQLFVARPLWEDIGREEDWIRKIIQEQGLRDARASINDLSVPREGPLPAPFGQLLDLKPIP